MIRRRRSWVTDDGVDGDQRPVDGIDHLEDGLTAVVAKEIPYSC